MALNVQHHFRLTFCGGEEIVRLKTLDPGESKKRICLCYCDDVVRNGINPKLSLEEILHHVLVAQLRNIRDAVDGIGKVGVVFEAEPVSRFRHTCSWYIRLIDVGVLIVDIKSL